MSARVVLRVGERVLLSSGVSVVVHVHYDGYTISEARGESHVPWTELKAFPSFHPDGERAVHQALSPWWEMLPEDARQVARVRLQIVQEVLTGFREGCLELARDGEPFWPFGETYGATLEQRYEHMAAQVTRERESDRAYQRRVERGDLQDSDCSPSTVKKWVTDFRERGLIGLVDKRSMKRSLGFEVLDPEFRQAILAEVETFNGDRSAVNNKEIIRRARAAMKKAGRSSYAQPARATGEFVTWMMKERGQTTRAQRSNAIRQTSGHSHFPAIRPGQVVAIDATRADVLVWDPLHEQPMSVEVLTALDVATRVVLACRVVPKSADAVDAGLLLYDIMRPFHMVVDGTKISDWRWAGLPETVDFSGVNVITERGALSPDGALQGQHTIPGVFPEAIRCDHGSIFVSEHFRALCDSFGIDLLLSRGRRPSDNAHGERIHLTYDAVWQQASGYKSNNVAGRGRKVENEPMYTATELEILLRRWIALDYHQNWHEGLQTPADPHARLSPIQYFDALLDVTGRLDIPVHGPYAFLPIKWGTVGHAGVEFTNMVYDSKSLDDFRNVRRGQFRAGDRAMPFFHDPHDLSRVWWMDPDTELIHEIPWRGRDMMAAPMTDAVLGAVRKRIAARGGNLALNKNTAQDRILAELTQLFDEPPTAETRAMRSAAVLRVGSSERDHADAHPMRAAAAEGDANVTRIRAPESSPDGWSVYDDEWPDLEAGS